MAGIAKPCADLSKRQPAARMLIEREGRFRQMEAVPAIGHSSLGNSVSHLNGVFQPANPGTRTMKLDALMQPHASARRRFPEPKQTPASAMPSVRRRDVEFRSGGVTCRAWAYAPR